MSESRSTLKTIWAILGAIGGVLAFFGFNSWDAVKKKLAIADETKPDLLAAPPQDLSVPSADAWASLRWEPSLWNPLEHGLHDVRHDESGDAVDVETGRFFVPEGGTRAAAVEKLNKLIDQQVHKNRLERFLDTCRWKATPADAATPPEGAEAAGQADDDGEAREPAARDRIEASVKLMYRSRGLVSLLLTATERCEAHSPSTTYYAAINYDLDAPGDSAESESLVELKARGMELCRHHRLKHCVWFITDAGLKVLPMHFQLPSFDSTLTPEELPALPFIQFQSRLTEPLRRRLEPLGQPAVPSTPGR